MRITNLLLPLLLLSLTHCSSATIQPVGDGQIRRLDDFHFSTDLPGKVAAEVNLENASIKCDSISKLPILEIKTEDGRTLESKPECRQTDRVIFQSFEGVVPPGKHLLETDTSGSLPSPLRGTVLFLPEEKEKKSGPDQAYPGATPLSDGVNQTTLSSAGADLTDWWTVTLDTYTPVSFFFQTDGRKGMVSAKVFRLNGSSLAYKQELPTHSNVTLGLEGTYYIKVVAKPYAPLTQYSISLKKMESKPQEGGAGGGVKLSEFPVLETWAIDSKRTAILIQLSEPGQIKEGETLKIFSGSQFLDICKVVGVGSSEFECHSNRTIQTKTALTARRSL